MRLINIFILIVFAVNSFSQNSNANKLRKFVRNNYKLQYPSSWELDTSKTVGPEFFLFSPLENEKDLFRENVNVIIQDLAGQNINLENYKQITDRQVIELVADGKIFESSISNKNKDDFYKITYAMTQGKYRLKITSVCFIKNDKAYLVTFSSEFDKYDNYKKIGEQILNSFTIIK